MPSLLCLSTIRGVVEIVRFTWFV
uniref:Uncharacterized protein n=1 Tax=Rhizophora mucronata TaxID=61149 RepID=A0A2P2NLB4_RHIMU